MKMSIKFLIAGAILFLLPFGLTNLFGFFCFAAGFILLIVQGVTEITSKNKAPKNNNNYTYINEARRAFDNVTPKRKRDEKPPWEE